MILKYIYLEEYKNIENQGFNFCPENEFSYDSVSGELKITKKEEMNLTPIIFGDQISSISAIIGKNGTGKSNLLDYIAFRLTTFDEVSFEYLYVTNGKEIIIFDNDILCDKTTTITNKDYLKKLGYKVEVEKKKKSIPFSIERSVLIAKNLSFLFYSNVLDGRGKHELNNLIDISTSYLITQDEVTLSKEVKDGYGVTRKDSYYSHEEMELNRQVKYITLGQKGFSDLQITKPNKIYIVLDDPKKPRSPFEISETLDSGQRTKYDLCLRLMKDTLTRTKLTDIVKLKRMFASSIVLFLFREYPKLFTKMGITKLGNWMTGKKDISGPYNLKGFTESEKEKVTQSLTDAKKLQAFFDKILSFSNYLEYEDKTFKENKDEWNQQNMLSLTLNDITYKHVLDFIRCYYSFKGSNDFLDFKWYGLSTGERALLTLYSRFFSVIESEAIQKKDNLIIMLDEPDIGFHPEWQRNLIDNIVDYFKKLYQDKKIQIIFTSHSPFVISDFPKKQVIFLNKDTDGNCIVTSGINMENTFAANIHTLLSDSFFMEDGLIGKRAKKIILALIEDMEGFPNNNKLELSGSYISNKKNIFKALIKEVGEPIIREKLWQVYSDKVSKDNELEIERLKERIIDLENEQNKLNEE